jgi:DNA-directed RNA polymerase subunit beta'
MDKKALAGLVDMCYRIGGQKKTVLLADRLRTLGFTFATHAGISICMDDMHIPESKAKILDEANQELSTVSDEYTEGLITDGERYNKVIDVWAEATERVATEMMNAIGTEEARDSTGKKRRTPSFNPIYMMADSGARGSQQQIRQLAGMRGLMAKPSGEIIETPITANFREGLTVLQYFISTHGARKGLADTALKTANSGYLTRRLVDVAQDATIIDFDCHTLDGIYLTPLVEGGEIIQPLSERILGRVALEDIKDPVTGDILVSSGEEIDESKVDKIRDAGIEKVLIRSVLTCRARPGICAKCYGRDLSRGMMVNLGEAAGVIAAQSIGEPGTQLTMRTFHIGGTATRRAEQSSLENRTSGTVAFKNLTVAPKKDDTGREYFVVMNRNGAVAVVDEGGRERERYTLIYGARLLVGDGQRIEPQTALAEWDPFAMSILTEVPGIVQFGDILQGVTMEEKVDEVTGLISRVITESKDPDARPRVSIKDAKDPKLTLKLPGTQAMARYLMPVGANILVTEGQELQAGDILAKIPRETTKTKDITGGLPRVAELFEARKPKDVAIISEIDGSVSFGKDLKGKRRVIITPEIGEPKEYLVAKGKHISVHEGDYIRAGEPNFLVDEQVDRHAFEEENERILSEGKQPAIGEPMLLGITKGALSSDSFISASSFQETTKVLTEAAIQGKTDHLTGLKENVIMGRLIPAGTGRVEYKRFKIDVELPEEESAEEKVVAEPDSETQATPA